MDKKQLLEHLKLQNFPQKIINAFKKVKREDFIPEAYKKYAYEDTALPLITENQTISQPTAIAIMLELLDLRENKNMKILEIGSGSGYVLSLVQEITKGKIYGVEIVKELAEKSTQKLKQNKNITVINKSGKDGLPEHAPYDRILVSASYQEIPKHLIKQLKDNGIIIASVRYSIVKIKKQKEKITTNNFPGFVFVPLVDS